MRYRLLISEKAIEQLRSLPKDVRRDIGFRLESMCDDLLGDVKKLKAHTHHYRLPGNREHRPVSAFNLTTPRPVCPRSAMCRSLVGNHRKRLRLCRQNGLCHLGFAHQPNHEHPEPVILGWSYPQPPPFLQSFLLIHCITLHCIIMREVSFMGAMQKTSYPP